MTVSFFGAPGVSFCSDGWHRAMSSVTGCSSQPCGSVMYRVSPVTTLVPLRSRPSASRCICSSISLLPPPEAPSCMIVVTLSYGVTTCTVEQWAVVQLSLSRSPAVSSIPYTPFLADGPG